MKLLSLDGGGMMGIGQAAILSRISDPYKFDAIAGTSVGSILGALLAIRAPATKLVSFFTEYGPKIFAGYAWRHFKLLTPKYYDKALNKALQELLSHILMGDVQTPLFVTAADLDNRKLKVYYSGDANDSCLPLWEVVRRAVAAESFFLPWKGMADGGLYANHPGMVGVTGCVSRLCAKIPELELCSIGTGEKVSNANVGSTRGWSMLHWGKYVVGAALDGASNSMHDHFVRNIGLKQYLRIQFVREPSWNMDNPNLSDKVLKTWEIDIDQAVAKVEAF